MMFPKKKKQEGVGYTKFWSILLMIMHSFGGRGFFLNLMDGKSLSFRDIKKISYICLTF